MEVLAPLTVDQTHCWYSPKWFLVKYTIQFLYVTKKLYVSGQDMCLTSQLYHFQEKNICLTYPKYLKPMDWPSHKVEIITNDL